jgi:hypothetical protein
VDSGGAGLDPASGTAMRDLAAALLGGLATARKGEEQGRASACKGDDGGGARSGGGWRENRQRCR